MTDAAEVRRREATRAAIRYFMLAFIVISLLGSFVVYAVYNARAQRRESLSIRIAYCQELEKLKKQNREDVAQDKKNYTRNLRLLGIKDTPELRKAAEAQWAKELRRNAPRSCPYTA